MNGSLVEVALVEFARNAGHRQVGLCQQCLGAIAVDTARCSVLGKKFYCLFERQEDVLIDIGALHLGIGVVVTGIERLGIVVHDRYFAEAAHEVEVCHGLPGEAFAQALVAYALGDVARRGLDAVIDGVAVSDDGPKGVGHVDEVFVRTVDREFEIGAVAHVEVARKAFAYLEEAALEIIPGGVVQVVDTCNALVVGLVIVVGVVGVLGRLVEEIIARRHSSNDQGGQSYIFI